ncbi:hypothetical protein ACFXPS_44020 [Nocardia sp. NPDC059091]|uniref:hypothetical protein n=1 Tax=unclassified Nocardia TaxID=2637762 RepID=UPI0036C4A7C0
MTLVTQGLGIEDKEIGVRIGHKVAVSVSAAAFVLAAMMGAPAANAAPPQGPTTGSSNLDCFIQILLHGEVPGVCG